MKKVILLFVALLSIYVHGNNVTNIFTATKQVKKVAILEPVVVEGEVSTIFKAVLRSNLTSSINNEQLGFQAFTRSDIDAILREKAFQNNGEVNMETLTQLTQLGGVDYLCISKFVEGSGYLHIDVTLVDVNTGQVTSAVNKLIDNKIETVEQTAKELGKKLVGLDVLEQEQAAEQERQRQLAEQQKQEQEQKRQEEEEAQEQLQKNLDELENNIIDLGETIAGAIVNANSYYLIINNRHTSPREITINGQLIGYVDGHGIKAFQVPIALQGLLRLKQTKGYLFSPNIETFKISGVKKGEQVTIRN